MPPMRCQHYFDDGQAIHDGCHYKHNCKFVHPQHDDWEHALRPIVQRERIYGPRDYSRGPLVDFVVDKAKGSSHRGPPPHGRNRSPSPISPSRGRYPPGAGHRRDESYASSSKASVDHSRERKREYDQDYGNGDPGARAKGKVMDVDHDASRRPDYERLSSRSPQRERDRSASRGEPLVPPPSLPTTTTTTTMPTSPRSPRVARPTAPRWQRSQDPHVYSPHSAPVPTPPSNAASASTANSMPAPPPPPPLSSAPLLPPPPHSAPIPSSRPTPAEAKPLGPLPQVPDLPSALQLDKESLGPRPPVEDAAKKEKLWEERIKLLAESVLSHETIQSLEEDQDTASKMLSSTLFASLDPAARARLVAQNTELKARIEAERAAYRRQRDLLVHQMFWPLAPPRRVSWEEEQQYAEMKGYVRELNSEVMGMKELLGEIEEIKKAAAAVGAGGKRDKGKGKERALDLGEGGDESMLVDDDGGDASMSGRTLPQASGTSSRKRRRLSPGQSAASAEDTRVTDPASPEYIPTAAELDALRELLAKCSQDVSEMQNEVTRAGNDWADTVKTTVEAELDAERARRAEEVEAREREVVGERERQREGVRRRVEEVKKQVGELGGQVVEVTESLAGLVLTAGRLEEEVELARRRREGAYERLGGIDVKMQSYKDAQARNVEAIATLRTALEAYLTQPPSPPVSPAPTAATFASASSSAPSSTTAPSSSAILPPAEYILQSLHPQLTDVARATMRPLLEALRGEIEDVIRKNNADVYRAFHEKMAKARQVVHAISQHLPHLAQGQGAGQGQGQGQGVGQGQAVAAGAGGTVRGGSGSGGLPGKAPSGTSTRTA